MFKRYALLIATNLAVVVLLGIVLSVLGSVFGIRFGNMGGNGALLVMSAVFGFGGAFISLLISKWVAKRSTGLQLIEQPRNEIESWLVDTVRRQSAAAGIKMPEVGIFDTPDINAFATGPSRNNSLVAVSSGLLRSMSRDEAEAVIGHEVTHVANGDMVTMTLVQGVLNTFVFFFARVVARLIDAAMSGDREEQGPGFSYYLIVFALDMVFGLFAQIIAMWFSRWREFRADAGGARLAGRGKMVSALQRLAQNHGQTSLPSQIQAFGISGGIAHGLRKLWMSHPPLEERIARLQAVAV